MSGSHVFARWGPREVHREHPILLTGHHYPLGCHQTPAPSIERLLSQMRRGTEIRVERTATPLAPPASAANAVMRPAVRFPAAYFCAPMPSAVMAANAKDAELLVIMSKGYGKHTPIDEYKVQGRGGSGIKTAEVTPKTGDIIGAKVVEGDGGEDEIVVISKKGQVIRCKAGDIPSLSRATQGVRIMKLYEGDSIASMVAL